MKPDALRMLARQLRTDPNSEAIEDAAAALEACARQRGALQRPFGEILGRPASFRCFQPKTRLLPTMKLEASEERAPLDPGHNGRHGCRLPASNLDRIRQDTALL